MDWTTIISVLISSACLLMQAKLNNSQKASEERRKDGEERMNIILECSMASLYGVHELGANNKVTGAIDRLEDYQRKKSSK